VYADAVKLRKETQGSPSNEDAFVSKRHRASYMAISALFKEGRDHRIIHPDRQIKYGNVTSLILFCTVGNPNSQDPSTGAYETMGALLLFPMDFVEFHLQIISQYCVFALVRNTDMTNGVATTSSVIRSMDLVPCS
jgi:hypothetical protein